jgi:cell division protein FtsQ
MKRWQIILRKVLMVMVSITGIAAFVVLLTSAINKQAEIVCTGINVNVDYESGLSFITKKEVADKVVYVSGDSLHNKKIASLNLKSIESILERQPYIDSAEAFFNQQLQLMVKVKQKRPILRIINNDGVSYYLSDKAETMPLSNSFTPRVPVVIGFVQKYTDAKQDSITRFGLWKLITAIEKDTFLHALTDQVNVLENGEIEIIPAMGNFTILFGKPQVKTNDKLKNIKTFYKEALPRVGWEKYKSINVKFENQVVCLKRETTDSTTTEIIN